MEGGRDGEMAHLDAREGYVKTLSDEFLEAIEPIRIPQRQVRAHPHDLAALLNPIARHSPDEIHISSGHLDNPVLVAQPAHAVDVPAIHGKCQV